MPLYTTGQAAKRAGTSPATVRSVVSGAYAELYRGLWSETATPAPGAARHFDAGDMRVLHYITSETARGQKHEDIAARIRAGALDDFQTPTEDAEGAPTESQTALAVLGLAQEYAERLQAITDAANERLLDAERRAAAAEREAEMLRARLDELQTRPRGLWRRLFGG